MRRSDVMNLLLSLFQQSDYLEIGVNAGQTFLEVNASTRTAVDPSFVFDVAGQTTDTTFFHEVTSDIFFGQINEGRRYDLVFIDGLHTFDQTSRDLVNALCLLKPGGVIVIDDVLPNSFHASLPDMELAARVREKFMPGSQDSSWMGNVYKVVYFVHDFVPQYSYATIAENRGLLIMWREPRLVSSPRSMEEVARAGFETIVQREADFNVLPMAEIMERVKRRL